MASSDGGRMAADKLPDATEAGAIRRYRTLLELAALDKSDFDTVLRRILAADAEGLGLARVNCWRFDREIPSLRCISGFTRGSQSFACAVTIRANDYPHYFQALAEDPIILAHEARSDPRTRELVAYLEPRGITSMMDVPIWVRGELWGVLCHEHVGPPRRWTEAERDFAVSVGHIVSMGLEASARAQAERTARFSEFFVGILSHDLRGPLTTIRGLAQMLQKRDLDEFTARTAAGIITNADRMNRMVGQLLDFTRIRIGGGLPVERSRVDLGELCRRVAADIQTAHEGCSVEVRHEGNPVGEWDADRLWQALANLLRNAAEHGTPGERILVRVDGTNTDEVLVHVINQGAVPSRILPVLFEPFRRPGAATHAGGLGLGLFIVREIVTAHGGTIHLEPHPAQTDFTVRLPRHPLPPAMPAN